MSDWASWLVILAAAINVFTAWFIWRFGAINRRRSHIQDEVNQMLHERIRMMEIFSQSITLAEHKKDTH